MHCTLTVLSFFMVAIGTVVYVNFSNYHLIIRYTILISNNWLLFIYIYIVFQFRIGTDKQAGAPREVVCYNCK